MYTIYHIPGVKVGCSKRVEARVRDQGYTNYEILEVCNTLEEATTKELYWQDKLGYGKDDSQHHYSYMNRMTQASKTEKAITKWKQSTDASEVYKKSQYQKGIMLNKDPIVLAKRRAYVIEKRKTLRPVLQFDLQNNLIKKWSCVQEAATTLNLDNGSIWKCCNGYKNKKTYLGFIWKYANP